jgi:integrase
MRNSKRTGASFCPRLRLRLRRTAASVWFAVGWDLPTVMASIGHRSERMTLAVYAKGDAIGP